ncbi:glycosyltransferase family 4 protein [Curtanaerobium respiraculi]|uniref:glycosyltransferase family 4 protein n=1 Tax=Curtanaerobium respiraculi TaxID=2949669 RepID=UPI0024B348DC|nr:glycosyltransferase family 4 protein [Curtanaerobium respiraculi]
MNILHVSAQKPDGTGSGTYLAETVKAFARLGHVQAVVAGIAPGDAPAFPEGVVFRPVVFETPELPFPVAGMSDNMPYRATRYRDMTPEMVAQFKAAFGAALDEVLASFQPDLVICHHLYLVCGVIAHRTWGCPVAAISHSTDIRQMRKIPLERAWIREGVRRLDLVFSLHDAQAEEIAEVYGVPRGRIAVVGAGYNDRIFHRGACTGAWHAGETLNIVYAGKIWGKKGVPQLLRAVDRIPGIEPGDVVLRLAGGYNSREEYEGIVRQAAACAARVEFLGRLSQDRLADLYRASHAFVLPSFFEGLPLVLIEALACGCRAVATDLPGVRPWLARYAPDAPIVYVKPPRMTDVDTPAHEDLPLFEKNLARALRDAVTMAPSKCKMSALSWDGLAARMLRVLGGAHTA